MLVRAKGLMMKLDAGVSVVLEDESDRRKDSVKLALTVLGAGDGDGYTVAEGLTREQADAVIDAFDEALSNEEDRIDFRKMGSTA